MKAYDAAFYIAAFFILGIAGASLKISLWLTLFLGIAVFIFIKAASMPKRKLFIWYGIFILAIFFGYFNYHFYLNRHEENIPFGERLTFQGMVFKEPHRGLDNQELDIELMPPYGGKVRIYASLYPGYNYGDILEVEGVINKSDSGRLNMMSFPETKVIKTGQGSSIKAFLYKVKNKLVQNLASVLPGEKAAFLSGILLGERGEFSDQFNEALKRSGTTHLVALSGYNVSIIATTISAVLAYICSRRKAFWLSVFFVVVFVLMTGAEESVVRAAIMGIIFLISQQSSRLYSFRNAITLTAAVMLFINPELLVFNVGFQLSFAALIGLVYLRPVIEKVFKISKKETFLNWRENLLQTSSAQAAALPIIIGTFGYFSPFSVIANVLILEFMPLTMFFGFITAFLGLLSYHLSLVAGWITGILLGYEIFIINFFSF